QGGLLLVVGLGAGGDAAVEGLVDPVLDPGRVAGEGDGLAPLLVASDGAGVELDGDLRAGQVHGGEDLCGAARDAVLGTRPADGAAPADEQGEGGKRGGAAQEST